MTFQSLTPHPMQMESRGKSHSPQNISGLTLEDNTISYCSALLYIWWTLLPFLTLFSSENSLFIHLWKRCIFLSLYYYLIKICSLNYFSKTTEYPFKFSYSSHFMTACWHLTGEYLLFLCLSPVAFRCWLKTGRFMYPCATDRAGHRWTTRSESGTTAGRWFPWQQRPT